MVISDEVLESAHVSEAEIRAEIAIALFARLANLAPPDFQALLALREDLVERLPVTAFLSEPALAAEWNRMDEDEAWTHLQRELV